MQIQIKRQNEEKTKQESKEVAHWIWPVEH